MPSLVKILLKIPGLTPDEISKGLKVPPLNVFSTEKGIDALKLKKLLEKFGAVCLIENPEAIPAAIEKSKDSGKERGKEKDIKLTDSIETTEEYIKSRHHHHRKFRWKFWVSIFTFVGVFAFITSYDFSCEIKPHSNNKEKTASQGSRAGGGYASGYASGYGSGDADASAAKANQANEDLKKDIEKNPYNADAWKALAKNLEKQGDTAAARKAKESHERAVKVQQVLAGVAKAFGNNVRVEVTEDAVYYRTSYDFTDDQFNLEAERLMDSLSVKFPGKNLFIENYTSDNRIQNIQLKGKVPPHK